MYQAGIYCRISIEEQNKEGEYSNSIHSQIQMARDYIAENKDIAEKKVYVDDGASGSNFERTEFRRMLADIELGVINMVIFKDVSRLGREHIDTNYYLGKYFPEKQIRIVSILDNYDSAVGTYDEMLEIKTLLNDMYLRDTSRKIKTTIQTKRSMGEYTPKQPPFGYVKSKTIHNHLEIDPYAAEVVRRIYRMYQNGFGCTVICRTLNEDEIPCPAKYKKEVLKTNYVLKRIGVEDKKKMVILGDGPVALAFLSCAKLMGIQEIYVLGNHRDKLETAEKLGAAGTFLNKDEEEKKKASDLFDRKSDICIDTIGSNQTITQCLDYIKETGTIAVYGLKSGENLNVPLPELRNFNIQYVQWPVPEVEAEVHKPVCDAIMDGKIDIDLFVTHRFSIDDYEKGFQAVKDRTALKVVLNF